jgi:hypothetical protein
MLLASAFLTRRGYWTSAQNAPYRRAAPLSEGAR